MKVIVVGGGMAGLTYAILSAKNGNKVDLYERNSRVGKKISMTGNGKCNIGNLDVDAKFYNESKIVRNVIEKISIGEYIKFLNSIGIFVEKKGSCLYPITESASSVVDCLRFSAEQFGVNIFTDSIVESILNENDGFKVSVNGNMLHYDNVVVACGLMSQAENPKIENLIKSQYLTNFSPSLVPIKIKEKIGILNGTRQETTVKLYANEKQVATQFGDVQFKDYGLSGICILNLSSVIARNIVLGKNLNYKIEIDMCPELSENQLQKVINDRLSAGLKSNNLFIGILKNKMAEYVLKIAKSFSPSDLCYAIKHAIFTYDKLLDYSMSQVTAGGVDEKYVDSNSLKLPNGIFVLGEALNVDGVCGGYNLFFAAASALSLFSKKERDLLYNNSKFCSKYYQN